MASILRGWVKDKRRSILIGYGKPHLKQEGKSDVGKQLSQREVEKIERGETKAPVSSDQSKFMKTVAKGPFVDAFAEFHDGLHELPLVPVDQISLIVTMPHSYALTVAAALEPYTQIYEIWKRDGEEKE